jgi:hypothetical protein
MVPLKRGGGFGFPALDRQLDEAIASDGFDCASIKPELSCFQSPTSWRR